MRAQTSQPLGDGRIAGINLAATILCVSLLAPTARAEIKIYSLGDGMTMLSLGETEVGSHDGYHAARLYAVGDKEIWEKDGVVYACSKDRCVYALDAEKGTGTARTA